MTLIDTFIDYLKEESVRYVFGVPGGLLHPFFAAVEREPAIDLVVAKHEGGAGFMADGYARTRSRLAVCAGTSGPGSTNLMTPVAVAHADGVPLLVLTGQAPSHSLGKGAAQEMTPEDVDIVSMFKPVTKYSAMVPSPSRFAHHLRRALRLALSGRPGPVHLNVPVDFWSQTIPPETIQPDKYRPSTTLFDRNAVKRAADALVDARRPVLLAGSGVGMAGAGDAIQRLAELLNARVATTPSGKGVFPETHRLSMGVLGFAGHQTAKETILGPGVDVLMCVGTSLNETTTFNWHPDLLPSRTMIHLDIDIDRIARSYPVDIAMVGDASTVLRELQFQLKRVIEQQPLQSVWTNERAPLLDEESYRSPELRGASSSPVTPPRWRKDLMEVLPEDAIIFSDIGGHMLFNIHDLRIGPGQRFVINLGFGSMGHGTVAPIGAALAAPHRPVFAIVGDACFTMHGMELLVAREHRIPVIWIVENNQMHGITWHGSQMVGDCEPMDCVVNNEPFGIAEMAGAMGVRSFTVEGPDQMQATTVEALERGGPCVIEVVVDRSVAPPLEDRAQTVGGFRR